MEMLLTLEEHYDFLMKQLEKKPQVVMVSTYGLYAGILDDGQDTTSWGDRYRSYTHDFMEALTKVPKVKMLVGQSGYFSCRKKERCEDCEIKFAKGIVRNENHALHWPQFEWRFIMDLHLKCFLFYYGDTLSGVSGGRNLGDSSWTDASFEIGEADSKRLLDHYKKTWGLANVSARKVAVASLPATSVHKIHPLLLEADPLVEADFLTIPKTI